MWYSAQRQKGNTALCPEYCSEVVHSKDDGVLALKWHDKRDVTMLSTYHDSNMVRKSRRSKASEGGMEEIQKPVVVEDYNQHMGGVDRSK